jgi:hypothetical protein
MYNAKHDMVVQCGAGDQPKGSAHIRGCGIVLYARGWSVPVDLPLLLSQTKHNRSLTAVDADVYSVTHDMRVQCGAGDKPIFDLLSAHTRL